jgi:UDP-N-acetylglucosamine 2-epimerase (non-hydrolysing)
MKIAIILGTRPEIIKMSPIIRECLKREIDFFIIHSNQHYSVELDKFFFEDLSLSPPKYNLLVGSGTHANQTGNILIKIEDILFKENPDIVLVQGDTNTVLASALAGTKLNLLVGHIEAGLRSYNRKMPEETNRVVTDHISDYLFCPTSKQKEILFSEGIPKEKIHVVGNTIVDAVFQNIDLAQEKSNVLNDYNLNPQEYFLVTAHRSLNVDNKENLKKLIKSLKQLKDEFNIKLIYPIHPRTQKNIEKYGLETSGLILVSPLRYLDFLKLQKNAKLILTDSGGVQEEACILGIPCVTLRDDTERPETVEIGANVIVGRNFEKIITGVKKMLNSSKDWKNPFGDGESASKILSILIETLKNKL